MGKRITWIVAGIFWIHVHFVLADTIPPGEIAPEPGTGNTEQELVKASSYMVAAANPYAARAGYDILKQGGSAIDAVIATQLVLNLVEPQSSGIGGVGLVVYFDKNAGQLSTWEGRENAPALAKPDHFLDKNGKPLTFYDAVVGGHSVATPGLLKLMYEVHQKHGKLAWQTLFKPAIKLAQEGFIVSPRLARLVAMDQARLSRYETTKNYFYPGGRPVQEGDLLKNRPFANTLSLIARRGIDPFYQGEIGRDIVTTVNSVTDNPGLLSMSDLRHYEVKERDPVCMDYREYQVCGMGPPSSGGLTVGQMLGLLDHHKLSELGKDNPDSWQLIGDATRLAFADRGQYIADPDFVNVPKGLLDKSYLLGRSQLLHTGRPLQAVAPGLPPGVDQVSHAPGEALELPATTHISIVDGDGNAVAMTSSVENAFGSRLMVRGFLLNNSMTDFSFRPFIDGKPVANRIAPGKRPMSSMSPTIVLRDGQPYMLLGSAGGSRIIVHVAKTIIAHLDWQLPVNEAVSLSHRINMHGHYELEAGTDAEALVKPLKAMGYKVSVRDLNSSLHAIVIKASGLEGAADPRREGAVMGD
ncbi:gamma-glutamyltransferase [Endozoicomonas sp. SCSIO W0465]|uniref:gamma-glutamyltransferase n=1 Tax=Endozoicomonas sp. SCSIO W0465 TaxID=2918516 RepID=UPI002075FD0D|nr:gamma-glutamyltransferase [Endozoicomonas sp. SCSIO W0465]USE35379.1 gamma-glutamyltransferase [Endozoicomonas sp. SCSIO W0465]